MPARGFAVTRRGTWAQSGWYPTCFILLLVCCTAAYANGDLFFEAMEKPGNPEYVVFGNVKDDEGKY
jgi:hypothetical protein